MTRTIVAATDLSERSFDVIPHAARLASAAGLHLVVLHAVNSTAITTAFPNQAERLIEEAAASAHHKIASALQVRGHSLTIHVTWNLPNEPLVDAILDGAVESGAILLAMASRGASLLRAVVPGSTAIRLFAHTHLPVLTTGDALAPPAADGRPYHILFATDGSAAAEAVAHASAVLLAEGGPWRVTVEHVDTPGLGGGVAAERIEARVRQLARWFPPETEVQTAIAAAAGPPAQIAAALCEAAVERQADAIAISSRSFRPLTRVLAGSVGMEVLRRSPVPVIFGR
jgi:nucleotide-binding universal stress UspA family protein